MVLIVYIRRPPSPEIDIISIGGGGRTPQQSPGIRTVVKEENGQETVFWRGQKEPSQGTEAQQKAKYYKYFFRGNDFPRVQESDSFDIVGGVGRVI